MLPVWSSHETQALEVFDSVEQTIGADGYTLTAIIDVLRRLGDWSTAIPLLDRLAALDVPPEQGLRTSVNAVLSAMGPDNYRRAKELATRAAEHWNCPGDVVTYGTLMLFASEQLPPLAPLSQGDGSKGKGQQYPPPSEEHERKDGGVFRIGGRGGVGGGASGSGGVGGSRAGSRRSGREKETVQVLRSSVDARAVPGESCLNMVMFRLAKGGAWEEAAAFVEAMKRKRIKVSRNQVGMFSPFSSFSSSSSALQKKRCSLFLVKVGL